MEQTLLEGSPESMKAQKVTRNHQHSFTKGKSCLTNTIFGSADKGRAGDVV